MALNALMKISNATGESKNPDYPDWIEIQGWDWEVEAETSWTKGGGASVGKPNPGKMTWEHYFDTSAPTLLRYIFSGRSFEEVQLYMLKGTGADLVRSTDRASGQQVFFKMLMSGVFITKVQNSATDEGNVLQKVEMVFKEVTFEYVRQDDETGKLTGQTSTVTWDIPGGTVD